MLNIDHLKQQIIGHAIAIAPQEMCGFVVVVDSIPKFELCANIHTEPLNDFAISAEDWARVSSVGEIVAVVHSHTDASLMNGKTNFSQIDKAACEKLNLPWVLAALPQQDIKILKPVGDRIPLLDREFSYGILDCYSLIRDAFAEIDIYLNDYPRGKLYEWLEIPGWNMYEENFAKEGFKEISINKLQKYDVFLMEIESKKINHAGLLWEPDKNIFIHHFLGHLSKKSVYGGYWKDCTVKVVRHESLFN